MFKKLWKDFRFWQHARASDNKISGILQELEEMRAKGVEEVDLEHSKKYLKIIVQELLPMFDYIIWQDPEIVNYLVMPVHNDAYPERNFNIILHKAGKKFPPEGMW